MGRLRLLKRIGPLVAAAVALASCGIGEISMAPLSAHGPADGRFRASFPPGVHERIFPGSGKRIPQYGVGVLFDRTYIGGSSTSNEVRVSVETLTNLVPKARLRPFLRSYLPSTHGGRIVRWDGHIAAIGFLAPGCYPGGEGCFGEEGTLVVIDGTTLFNASTEQTNLTSAVGSLSSFHIGKGY
jgi:hypothetical protein